MDKTKYTERIIITLLSQISEREIYALSSLELAVCCVLNNSNGYENFDFKRLDSGTRIVMDSSKKNYFTPMQEILEKIRTSELLETGIEDLFSRAQKLDQRVVLLDARDVVSLALKIKTIEILKGDT